MHTSILKDEIKNKKLIDEGYCTIPILNSEQLKIAIEQNKKCNISWNFGKLDFSFVKENSNLMFEAKKILDKQILQDILFHFHNYKSLGYGFINKGFGLNNTLSYHQDWTITDERISNPIAIWCPLQETSDRNGGISVIPYTHLVDTGIRTLNTPTMFFDFDDLEINYYTEVINLKAGEALVYFPNLFHGTSANKTFSNRRAMVMTLLEANNEAFFYDNIDTNIYNRYKLPDDFNINYHQYIIKNEIFNLPIFDTVVLESNRLDKSDVLLYLSKYKLNL